MPSLLRDELLEKLEIQDLVSYLHYSPAWHEVAVKEGWQLFVSDHAVTGIEIELLLPQRQDNHIFPVYAGNVVNVLSQLNGEQPEMTVERVSNVDRDVLLVRNIGEQYKDSISIYRAAKQINKLQTIIKQASNSERDASPHYRSNYYNPLASSMINQFQFGHTQNRSFGLTVKSPTLVKPMEYRQTSLPLPGVETDPLEPAEPVETFAPIARRIVERVVRGLLATKAAVERQNVDFLVMSYQSGFNSNMCEAFVDLTHNKESSIEYGVLWSPLIAPPDDVADFQPTRLFGVDYSFLEIAANKLKAIQPNDTVKVRGTIDSLASPDDPNKFGVGQSIIIKWENDDGRIIKIMIDLNPKEYQDALGAHGRYDPVEATGELREIGNRWRLLNPRDFRVVPRGE